MRLARMIFAVALALVLTWPARSDTFPYSATVKTANAEVRCKPTTEPASYVTQTLPPGTTVEVVEKSPDGWLKIYPPEQSISWVRNQIIGNKPILSRSKNSSDSKVWAVENNTTPVPVLAGSLVQRDKRDTIGTYIQPGTLVVVVGPPESSPAGDLLPILSAPGEYRYIREADVSASTVAPPAPAPTVAASPGLPPMSGSPSLPSLMPTAAAPSQPSPNVVVVPTPAAVPAVDPLFQQADQLERSGDKIGAARLYDQLGGKYLASNRDVAMQYYNRAAWLRATAVPAASAPLSDADALYQQARQYEQAGNRAEAARLYMKLGDLFRDSDFSLARRYYSHAGWLRQSQSTSPTPPATTSAPATTTAGASPPPTPVAAPGAMAVQMIGPGYLARSASPIDGRPAYVLESPQKQVIAYVAPQPGVDVEHYLGQNVELLGQIVPRTDVAGQFMSVIRVRSLTAP